MIDEKDRLPRRPNKHMMIRTRICLLFWRSALPWFGRTQTRGDTEKRGKRRYLFCLFFDSRAGACDLLLLSRIGMPIAALSKEGIARKEAKSLPGAKTKKRGGCVRDIAIHGHISAGGVQVLGVILSNLRQDK